MPILDVTPDEFTIDVFRPGIKLSSMQLKTMVTMHWPTDEAKRKSVILSLVEEVHELRILNDAPPLIKNHKLFLENRGSRVDPFAAAESTAVVMPPSKSNSQEGMSAGNVAGAILLSAFNMQSKGDVNITVDKCLKDLRSDLTDRRVRMMNARVEDLRKHWVSHHSVAGFWAASMKLHMDKSTSFYSEEIKTDNLFLFSKFLYLADLYQERGENIKVRNSGPLLKPGTTWRLDPDVRKTITGPRVRLAPEFLR